MNRMTVPAGVAVVGVIAAAIVFRDVQGMQTILQTCAALASAIAAYAALAVARESRETARKATVAFARHFPPQLSAYIELHPFNKEPLHAGDTALIVVGLSPQSNVRDLILSWTTVAGAQYSLPVPTHFDGTAVPTLTYPLTGVVLESNPDPHGLRLIVPMAHLSLTCTTIESGAKWQSVMTAGGRYLTATPNVGNWVIIGND